MTFDGHEMIRILEGVALGQMRADRALLCEYCASGNQPNVVDGAWIHGVSGENMICPVGKLHAKIRSIEIQRYGEPE